MKIGNGELN